MKNPKFILGCNIVAAVCFGFSTYMNITSNERTLAILTALASVSSLISFIINLKNYKKDNKQ